MIGPVSTQNGRHYSWGEGCDGWFLADEPALAVIRERMPPGTAEVRHLHERATQFFFVLSGEATIAVEGQQTTVVAEQGLTVRAGMAHSVLNAGDGQLEFLVVSAPPTATDRLTLEQRR